MSKKYKGVFRDSKGRIYCQTKFKASATGKRQRFKRYRNIWGKSFSTEKEAYDELCRARVEFYDKFDYSDYNLNFEQYMLEVFYLTTNKRYKIAHIELRSLNLIHLLRDLEK